MVISELPREDTIWETLRVTFHALVLQWRQIHGFFLSLHLSDSGS
jgi:hypothetical protein